MNEFDELEEQNNLEVLKEIVPSWVNNTVEPFIPAIDANITPPIWNKVELQNNFPSSTASPSAQITPGSVNVVIAKQEGSTMVPVLMTPVEGTLFTEL